MVNIAIFVSGSGSNCENIIQYFQHNKQVHIALVVSNRSDAYALVRAKKLNVPTAVLPKADFNNKDKVLKLMADYRIELHCSGWISADDTRLAHFRLSTSHDKPTPCPPA